MSPRSSALCSSAPRLVEGLSSTGIPPELMPKPGRVASDPEPSPLTYMYSVLVMIPSDHSMLGLGAARANGTATSVDRIPNREHFRTTPGPAAGAIVGERGPENAA